MDVGSAVRGRVVMVTGGGTGIGAAIAERFAAEGAEVVLVGRRPSVLEPTALRLGATAIVADSADAQQMQAAVAQVIAQHGTLDVLIANAGGHGLSAVADTTDADWESSLRGNLTTAFVAARECLPALIASRGQVVIISSLAGLLAGPGVAGYTVGKHALIGLTRTLARDYGRQGVRVNAICPGWVRTPMADQEMDDFAASGRVADREAGYLAVTRDVPLGRVGEPAEIAAVARFLGSSESSYITGAVIVADGGAHVVDVPTLALSTE